MATVVLLGTLDTKGHEYAYLRDRLRGHGVDVLLVDAGVQEPLVEPDLAVDRAPYGDRGAAFVIDNDATRSTFGGWFRRGYPSVDPTAVERFWSSRGWTRVPLEIEWRFERREDLEAVVGIEFQPALAREIVAEHEGLVVDYAVNLWWRRY